MSKIAVIYARYSSHRQGEQSIEGQIAEAYRYAAENDYKIVHEYIDRAMTGRNDNREQFQQMLADTAKHQFDTILLWKIDRFGRNREEIAFNKYRCRKNGVKVVRVAEQVPDTPEGIILDSVMEGMAEYYSVQMAQNIRRGLQVGANKALALGVTTYGYVTDPTTKKYAIHPEQGPIVQRIFDRIYSRKASVSDLKNELNTAGLRNARGNPFTNNHLYSILHNKKYIGVYTYGDVLIEDAIPPIVSKDVFEGVQRILETNKRAHSNTWDRGEFMLSEKLFCGHCGAKMTGECGRNHSGVSYRYYACHKRKRYHACDKKNVRKAWIGELVMREIKRILNDENLLCAIADAVWEYYKETHKTEQLENPLKAELTDTKKAIANIVKAIEAGAFNETIKARLDELEEQKAEIEYQLEGIELSKKIKMTHEYILFYLLDFRNGNADDPSFRRKLYDTFVNTIYLYDDKLTITFNYTASGSEKTLTLNDIEALKNEGSVFDMSSNLSTKRRRSALALRLLLVDHQSNLVQAPIEKEIHANLIRLQVANACVGLVLSP